MSAEMQLVGSIGAEIEIGSYAEVVNAVPGWTFLWYVVGFCSLVVVSFQGGRIVGKGGIHITEELVVEYVWPAGKCHDVYEGGKAYEIEAPIETLPIFLRDGKQGYLVGEIW